MSLQLARKCCLSSIIRQNSSQKFTNSIRIPALHLNSSKRNLTWNRIDFRSLCSSSRIFHRSYISVRTVEHHNKLRNLSLEDSRRFHTASQRYSKENEGDRNSSDENKTSTSPGKKILGEAPTERYGEYRSPIALIKKDLNILTGALNPNDLENVPTHSDIVIIGGGAIGMATAYWLKQSNPRGFDVTVIERDPTYTKCATTLSVGGLRQQFSLEENIKMSLFTAEFLRDIKQHLSVLDFEPPDVSFNHQGYLILATEQGAENLKKNYETQTALGAKLDLMSAQKLKERFPWLNTEDVECGTYGIQNEGWMDPWLLLCAMKAKAASLGVHFITGDVVGFTSEETDYPMVLPGSVLGTPEARVVEGSMVKHEQINNIHVKVKSGKVYPIHFAMCAICAGPWARDVARLAGIGTGKDIMQVDVPVEPRKRYVFMFHCADGPGLDTPMLVDPSGVYVRREGLGGNYICGSSPPPGCSEPCTSDFNVDYEFFEEVVWPALAKRVPAFEKLKGCSEPCTSDFNVDYEFFEEVVWPALAKRVPAFEKLKLKSAWAGYYDYNYFDQNLIIGNHPYHRNIFMAVGSSGHGLQHSPAIGRALMEYMTEDGYQTIDLSRMSFDRVLDNTPLFESEIV